MKEGSVLLVALLLAAPVAYWADSCRSADLRLPVPAAAPLMPPGPALAALAPVARAERLDVSAAAEGADKTALCEELAEVVRDVDAALLHPRSPAATEQLAARQRMYIGKRVTLGC